MLRLKSEIVRRLLRLLEKMTLALLREMQVCNPLCGLYWYAWFDNGSHVPCTYTIKFGLLFVFYLHDNKIQQINVIFNRFYDSP